MSRVIFLHHSTGKNIWLGGTSKLVNKITGKNDTQEYFRKYNQEHGTKYSITEQYFPNLSPYGWKNYPYDYYNIWVKNAGELPFMGEPTLEMLTRNYEIIMFKHCYPVSNILPDTGYPDIDSEEKRLENYKLQYIALKKKMHEFPGNKFIIWTPAVHVKSLLSEEEAGRTLNFHDWIINDWHRKGSNIFVWDFYKYETEGKLFLKDEYAEGPDNSHPSTEFSARVNPLLCKFIIDVIETR